MRCWQQALSLGICRKLTRTLPSSEWMSMLVSGLTSSVKVKSSTEACVAKQGQSTVSQRASMHARTFASKYHPGASSWAWAQCAGGRHL